AARSNFAFKIIGIPFGAFGPRERPQHGQRSGFPEALRLQCEIRRDARGPRGGRGVREPLRYFGATTLSLTSVDVGVCEPSTTYDVLAAWIKSVRSGGSWLCRLVLKTARALPGRLGSGCPSTERPRSWSGTCRKSAVRWGSIWKWIARRMASRSRGS